MDLLLEEVGKVLGELRKWENKVHMISCLVWLAHASNSGAQEGRILVTLRPT